MNDTRVKVFREALERLTEALEATVRLERWDPSDAVPEPLRKQAAGLLGRLDLVTRLSADTFVGSHVDMAKVTAMRLTSERLVAAYGAYRENPASAEDRRNATMTLEEELQQAKSEMAA